MSKPNNIEAPITPAALRGWRERHGMTQTQLAEHLGVGRKAVGHWETGERGISTRTARQIRKLAGELGVPAPRDRHRLRGPR